MEFMLKAEKKLKSFSLFGNKKEEALELYQKGAVSRRQRRRTKLLLLLSCLADQAFAPADLLQTSKKVAGGGRCVRERSCRNGFL